MEIIFHMGAPRAGSSALQKAWGDRLKTSDSVDFEQIRYSQTLLAKYLRLYTVSPNSKLLGHWMAWGLGFLLAMRRYRGGKQLILSEEIFAGEMLGKSEKLFERIDLALTTVKRMNHKHDCKIVILVRRQNEYVQSCYRFRVERGEKRTISEFIQDLNESSLKWNLLLRKAESYGLLEKLYIVDFDTYIKNGDLIEGLPLGFDQAMELKRLNGSAKLPEVYSFMRHVSSRAKVKLCRAMELERKMLVEKIDLVSAASMIYGNQSWISDCYELAMEHCVDGVFTDVTLSDADCEKMDKLTKFDKGQRIVSPRCFGDFASW